MSNSTNLHYVVLDVFQFVLYPVPFFIVILGMGNVPIIFIRHCILRTDKQRFFRRVTEKN